MLLRQRVASALVSTLACCALTTATASASLRAQTPPTQTRPRTTTATDPPSTRPQTSAPTSNVVPPAPTPESTSQTSDASEVSPDEADLAITANVTARELRFEVVPNPTVNFTGRPERRTVWEAERQNLPPAVRPGETYRDIGIRLRILSVFADIDRIVAEALGEIPLSDDTQPTTRAITTTPTTSTTIPPTTSEKNPTQQKSSTSFHAQQAAPPTPTANSQTGRGVQP